MHYDPHNIFFPAKISDDRLGIDEGSEWIEREAGIFKNILREIKRGVRKHPSTISQQVLWLEGKMGGELTALWTSLFQWIGLYCWEELTYPEVNIRKHSLLTDHKVLVIEQTQFKPDQLARVFIAYTKEVPSPSHPAKLIYEY